MAASSSSSGRIRRDRSRSSDATVGHRQGAPSMDHAGFQSWLDRYVDAWRLLDPIAIGDLFTPNVRYAFDPWGEAVVGRAAGFRAWLENPADRGSWGRGHGVLPPHG